MYIFYKKIIFNSLNNKINFSNYSIRNQVLLEINMFEEIRQSFCNML